AEGEFTLEPIKLLPRPAAVEIEVGAEAPRVDRRANDPLFEIADRFQPDDRYDLARDIREHVTGRLYELWRAARLVTHVGGEELLDHRAAGEIRNVGRCYGLAVPLDSQRARRIVITRAQAGEPLVAHQHQEIGFWHPFR